MSTQITDEKYLEMLLVYEELNTIMRKVMQHYATLYVVEHLGGADENGWILSDDELDKCEAFIDENQSTEDWFNAMLTEHGLEKKLNELRSDLNNKEVA